MLLVKGFGYDVEIRGEDVVLSYGTPERGETLELNNFNSSALSGTITHYCNGSEYLNSWIIINDDLKLLSCDSQA